MDLGLTLVVTFTLCFHRRVRLEVLDQPLYSGLERAFLSGLHLWIAQVATNSESMSTALPILSLIARPERFVNLVSFSLSLRREHLISGATVDQDRCF